MYRLVIADDEPAVLSYMVKEIPWENYGFQICGEAGSGREALALVEKLHPHLLITDIRMDDMSGLQVLERVRTEFPQTQVVMLSAYSLFEYAQQAILHSAAGYLVKPIEMNQLEEVLKKVQSGLKEPAAIAVEQPAELAREYIRAHFHERLTLERVATACFVHPNHLSRLFRTHYNTTFSDYLTHVRMVHAKEKLRMSDQSVREIASEVGYDDYSYFCRVFRKEMGVTPLEYRCNIPREGTLRP